MSRGEKAMYRHLRSTFSVMLCLLGFMSPVVFAADQPSKPLPAAQLIAVEGASHTYQLIDYDKRVVTAVVPGQSVSDIQMSNPDGTVRATIVSIDLTTNRVKAQTDGGQVLVLAMARDDIGSMKIGDTFTLTVSQRAAVAVQR
jgi:hypothetical protein